MKEIKEQAKIRLKLDVKEMKFDTNFAMNTIKFLKEYQRYIKIKISECRVFQFELINGRWIDEMYVKAIEDSLEILTDRKAFNETLKLNRRKIILSIYVE